jgi:hypothetical protein
MTEWPSRSTCLRGYISSLEQIEFEDAAAFAGKYGAQIKLQFKLSTSMDKTLNCTLLFPYTSDTCQARHQACPLVSSLA